MASHFKWRLAAALALLSAATAQAQAAPAAPYAGQQQRAIKSLSDSDVSGLLAGQGAGLAKAAELNGYPGPAHVLELSKDLGLSESQTADTRSLMTRHKQEASRLGAALVDAERDLDGLFARREATPAAVDTATARIGELQAQLRAEHLKTHLAQTALLDAQQVQRYASLRGYGTHPGGKAPESNSHSHGAGIGVPGKVGKSTRTVEVDMTDAMRFNPSSVAVKQGETVRFVVRNSGQLKHEFVLGTEKELKEHYEVMKKFPEMEHADPNMVTVAPGKTGEVIWQFTRSGTVDFAWLQPGHYGAGMKGAVKVAGGKAAPKSATTADGHADHKH